MPEWRLKNISDSVKQVFTATESIVLGWRRTGTITQNVQKPTTSDRDYMSWPENANPDAFDAGSLLDNANVIDMENEVTPQPRRYCACLLDWICFPLLPCINTCSARSLFKPSTPSSQCSLVQCTCCNNLVDGCSCLKSQHLYNVITLIFPLLVVFFLYWKYYDEYLSKILKSFEDMDERLALALFVVMFTIASLPFVWGYVVLNLAAGYRYGVFNGVLVVMASVTVGLSLTHRLSQRFCAKCVINILQRRVNGDQIESIMKVLNSPSGLKVIALARLTPIPFGLQNGIFSMSSIKTRHYVAASNIGLLPTQVLNCYIGSTFHSAEDIFSGGGTFRGYVLFFIQLGVGMALMTFVIRRARTELAAALKASNDATDASRQCKELTANPETTVRVSQPLLSEIV